MYRKYIYSVLSLLLVTIGHGNFAEMFESDITWSVIFFTIYFFGVVYFLLAAFMGIYMDAYKIVRLLYGYNDKQNFNWKDFVSWLCVLYFYVKRKLFPDSMDDEDEEEEKQEEDIDFDDQ